MLGRNVVAVQQLGVLAGTAKSAKLWLLRFARSGCPDRSFACLFKLRWRVLAACVTSAKAVEPMKDSNAQGCLVKAQRQHASIWVRGVGQDCCSVLQEHESLAC